MSRPSSPCQLFPAALRLELFTAVRLATLFAAAVLAAAGGTQPLGAQEAGAPLHPETALLKTHCYDCHQGADAEAGLDLSTLSQDLSDAAVTRRWVRIFDRVAAGEMPPPDAGALPAGEKAAFLQFTGDWIRGYQQAQHAQFGRVRGRRLTRREVERSLQDLLGIDIPLADQLPEESRSGGFSTVADAQAMSHFQLERHLAVVDVALDEAFRRALSPPDELQRDMDGIQVARRPERKRTREPEIIDGRSVVWSSGLIFYGRIPATTAPESGWYRFRVRVAGLKLPETGGVWTTVRSGLCVSSAPLLAWVTAFEATEEAKEVEFECWLPERHMLEIRPGDVTLKKARFAGGQVGSGEGGPQDVPGIAIERITMERIHRGPDDDGVRRLLFGNLAVRKPVLKADPEKPQPEPTVRAGKARQGKRRPPQARSRQDSPREVTYKVLSTAPQQDAQRLIEAFARRAFRRPVSSHDSAPYVAMVHQALDDGDDFATALRIGYRAILCSPRFLYLTEAPGILDHHATASRLSYLLTGGPPDEELVKLADAGQLRTREALREQVERLLSGPGGRQFVEDFAAEWLDLDQIDFTEPDRKLFPKFDAIVQHAMLDETRTYLETMLRENQSVSRLIESDFTFLNSRLARFYEIDGVTGDELRRFRLQPEHRRGGVLTQGAVLKVTANGTNTSPVIRGVWVSERLLGEHIPPPPDNVPAIEPDIRGAETIRELLAKHRSQDACASCHVKIDPPGFALENYDPAGQWRERYVQLDGNRAKRGPKIDASYEMPGGSKFDDIDEFRGLVVAQPEKLAHNLAEKLLVYGTGAPVAFADRPAIDKIVAQAAEDNYGFRSLVHAVVTSPVFLTK